MKAIYNFSSTFHYVRLLMKGNLPIFLLLVPIVIVAACSKNDSSSSSQALSKTAEDPKSVAFKKGISSFIEEAKSLSRAMDTILEERAFVKRLELLELAYSRIPDPPSEKNFDLYHKSAQQITVNYKTGELYLHLAADAIGRRDKEGADDCIKTYKKLATTQRKDIDELEAAVNTNRVPSIDLSAGIKNKR